MAIVRCVSHVWRHGGTVEESQNEQRWLPSIALFESADAYDSNVV